MTSKPQVWKDGERYVIEGFDDIQFKSRLAAEHYYSLYLANEKKTKWFWRWSRR